MGMEVTASATPDRATPKTRIKAVSLFLVCTQEHSDCNQQQRAVMTALHLDEVMQMAVVCIRKLLANPAL